MRNLDPTLSSSMDTGNYDPYFLATIQDNYTGKVLLSGTPTEYELSDLELVLSVERASFLDVPFYRTSIVLTRGVTVAGSHYTLSTSKFTIINSTWDGNFQTFKCHLIPRVHYSAAGDLTYKEVIDAFCTTFGKTAVYLDPAAAWLDYQFLPSGKPMTLNNAQTFFQQLKQKYFIFACDNGNDEILFYTAFTHVASPQYSITGYRFAVDYNVDQRRQYMWRDEVESLHRTSPSFSYVCQLDANVQAVMSLLDLGTGVVLAGSYKNAYHAAKIFRSIDYGLTWDAGYDTGWAGLYSLVHLGGGIVLASGYPVGFVCRSTDYGLTWTEVRQIGDYTSSCLTDCGNGIVLLGHTNPGGTPGCQVWKSLDYGLTWAQAQSLAGEVAINSILYVGAGVCLAGSSTGGKVWRSTDYGSTWTSIQQLGAEAGVTALLGLGSGIVLAGTNPGGRIFKSLDDGLTWTETYDSPETTIYTLNTLGGGVCLAGTGMSGNVYRSTDFGENWDVIQALGTEQSVRSFLTLSNGSTLAGTGEHAYIYKSLNCAADLDVIHNLGFMPSYAVEPSAYFLLAQPKFDPFPVHLKYQSSDFIRVNLLQGGIYDFTCAQVTEILKMQTTQKVLPYRMVIGQTEWLSNTAVGPLPGTIERVASYTPLVTTNFDGLLDEHVNNLQALADAVDDLVVDEREMLKADRTYYVRLDGSDSNTGLYNSAVSAFATLQHAWEVVCGLDMSIYSVTIKCGNGTHTAGLVIDKQPVGSRPVNIIGDEAAPANVILSIAGVCLFAAAACNIYFSGFKLQTSGGGNGVYVNHQSAMVNIGHINFGAMSGGNHMWANTGGKILLSYSYTISGGATRHMLATNEGIIESGSITVTLTGTPAFTTFAESTFGLISLYVPTFSGSATGTRYYIVYNAFLNTFAGVTLPGNAAGVSGAGGQVA